MINHVYTVLYNLSAAPASGIFVDLEEILAIPDVLLSVVDRLADGDNDAFALQCLKILDGSSYRLELTKHDSRLTYSIWDKEVDGTNLLPFMDRWLSLGPTVINFLINQRDDVRYTYQNSELTQEMAAALIIAYIDKITEYNE